MKRLIAFVIGAVSDTNPKDFLFSALLNAWGILIVRVALREYAIYSTFGELGVYAAMMVAFLLFCWAKKSAFICFARHMREKRVEYYGGKFSQFLFLMGLFAINLQVIVRADFGDGVTMGQILMLTAFNHLLPYISREIIYYGLRPSNNKISS